jgi:integrase
VTDAPHRGKRRANGQGSIYQRASDGRWIGAAYVLQPDSTIRRRTVSGTSEQAVREKLTELQANHDQGVPADATGWTVAAWLAHWLEHIVKPRRKPSTYHGYEMMVRVHIGPALGRKALNRLTAADVRRFVSGMENRCLCCQHGTDAKRDKGDRRCCAVGRCCGSRPSRRLVQQAHAVLRNGLQAAVREELIRRNVAMLVQVPAPRYDINRGLTAEQARALLSAAKGNRLYALFVMALYLGLRRGELLGLRWEDIDTDKGTVTIRRNLQRVGGALVVTTPKTGHSVRTLPLLGLVADALAEHRKIQDAEREAAGSQWVATGHVFTTRTGTAIDPGNLRRAWEPIRDAAGLGSVVFHGVRHTCVTLLLGLGVPPHVVRDIAGHSAIHVTMTIYAHTSMDDKRQAIKRLDQRLTGDPTAERRGA